MKQLLLLLLFITCSLNFYAQDTSATGKCGNTDLDTTEFKNQPWYDNNDYLEHFLDSIGYPQQGGSNRIIGSPTVKFWIPIHFWIYRNDDGSGGPTHTQIQNLVDNLNRRFNVANNSWIGFYMKCSPTYINNSTHVVKTLAGASLLMGANNDAGSINIHVIGSFHRAGLAGFAIPTLNACIVPANSYLQPFANADLPHEVGHVLGLQHTHQYAAWDWKCLTECVSRTRTWPTLNLCPTRVLGRRVCEATGDGLRDTQADNDLVNNNSCTYNVNFGDDPWGDSYDNPPAGIQDRPNIRNIMSYNSATDCIDQFSRLQIAVMLWTLYFKKTNNVSSGWTNPNSTFDSYEPDNVPEMTENINRRIQINQIQERNFNQEWNRVGGFAYFTQCDVDWVRFTASCTNSFTILTSAIQNRTNANTRLTLFNNTLTQLAQNDDISGSNLFSSITFNFTGGTQYFIRIENMSSLVTGYYNLQIIPTSGIGSIIGPDPLCSPSAYTVNNLPQGSNVIWSVNPANIVSLSCTNCNQTTASVAGNGTATLSANVSGCATYTKTIRVGVPEPPIIFASNYDAQCGTFFEAYCTEPTGWTGFRWDINFGQYVQDQTGNFTNYVYVSPLINQPQTGQQYYNYVSVQARNACGLSAPSETLQFTVGPVPSNCGGGGGPILLRVAPNPGTNTVIVETTDNTKFSQLRIYDRMGNLRKQLSFPATKKLTLNVSDIPAEIYNIRVFTNNSWRSTGFIKQ